MEDEEEDEIESEEEEDDLSEASLTRTERAFEIITEKRNIMRNYLRAKFIEKIQNSLGGDLSSNDKAAIAVMIESGYVREDQVLSGVATPKRAVFYQRILRECFLPTLTYNPLLWGDMDFADISPFLTAKEKSHELKREEMIISAREGVGGVEVHPDEVADGVIQCPQCKKHKVRTTEAQTRSADEPMTVFALCVVCGKRWRFS